MTDQIYKNYSQKILDKIYGNTKNNEEIIGKVEDINNFVIFFNYCFNKRNNFFIKDFNKKSIYKISESYNKLKSNILSQDPIWQIWEIFSGIPVENIKALKFIIYRFLSNYEKIYDNGDDEDRNFCDKVNKKSIENCLKYLEDYMNAFSGNK